MFISTENLCRLAGELADEHGELALDYTRRAYRMLEGQGETERAQLWFTLSVLVDDVIAQRLDPDGAVSIQ